MRVEVSGRVAYKDTAVRPKGNVTEVPRAGNNIGEDVVVPVAVGLAADVTNVAAIAVAAVYVTGVLAVSVANVAEKLAVTVADVAGE